MKKSLALGEAEGGLYLLHSTINIITASEDSSRNKTVPILVSSFNPFSVSRYNHVFPSKCHENVTSINEKNESVLVSTYFFFH